MYVPAHFAPDAALVDELLRNHGAADLVTVTEQGLVATMLPFIYVPPADSDAAGTHGALHGHLARNNDQWKLSAAGESLAIVRGPDAYISPAGTPSKAEHGRVVPTWNYVTAHVYGRLVVHDDPALDRGPGAAAHRQARGLPRPPVVGGRRAARLHRGAAAGHRRNRARDHQDRGEGQAQPEPPGRRRRRA